MLYIRNQKPLRWTAHAKFKMNFYRLSAQRVRRVLTSPKRIESGIAPETIAMMQPQTVKSKMENVLDLKVPLEVDINVGNSWYEAK